MPIFSIDEIENVLKRSGASVLKVDRNYIAISKWVSAKRTRSYPYTHVYDMMGFGGKKLTVIPIYKDEGKDGDRDFLQFDTLSLMTLLNVNVIIAYYTDATRNDSYPNKITNQRYDISYVRRKIYENLNFYSDALHWNREQLKKIGDVGELALKSYSEISRRLRVSMHSESAARRKIDELKLGEDVFRNNSRQRAREAQRRESLTIQPKELLEGEKGTITITNYYNGFYAFTVDEAVINGESAYLIEAKHSKDNDLPNIADIKDALLKLIVYTNLKTVTIDGNTYKAVPVIKLTNNNGALPQNLREGDKETLKNLEREANENGFLLNFNGTFL